MIVCQLAVVSEIVHVFLFLSCCTSVLSHVLFVACRHTAVFMRFCQHRFWGTRRPRPILHPRAPAVRQFTSANYFVLASR